MLLLIIVQLSLLPFPFDFLDITNFHRIFTELSRTSERTTIMDISLNIHGTFKDLRTNGNYGLFRELSRTYGRTAITEISRNIRGFTNVTELFENNHGNWS